MAGGDARADNDDAISDAVNDADMYVEHVHGECQFMINMMTVSVIVHVHDVADINTCMCHDED